MNEQVKLAKSEEQPIRKYRTVFTSTKGLFKLIRATIKLFSLRKRLLKADSSGP
jgi:hypothetical protein